MQHWSDVYPHKIWTNILVIDNKVIDYKIGGSVRDKFSWTMRFNKELYDRFDEIKTISTYEIVNNNIEHNLAFDKGRDLVELQVEKHGYYSYD